MNAEIDATGGYLEVTAELKYEHLLQYSISEVILIVSIDQTFTLQNDETYAKALPVTIRISPDY